MAKCMAILVAIALWIVELKDHHGIDRACVTSLCAATNQHSPLIPFIHSLTQHLESLSTTKSAACLLGAKGQTDEVCKDDKISEMPH